MSKLVARDIMTKELLTARGDWSLDQVADFFVEHGITGAPVLAEDDALIGVISVSDLAAHAADGTLQKDRQDRDQNVFFRDAIDVRLSDEEMRQYRIAEDKSVSVKEVMTQAVFSVEEDSAVGDVAATMINGRIHRVVVAKGNTIVGIITTMDLLKLLVDE